jgi:hypothetical protein
MKIMKNMKNWKVWISADKRITVDSIKIVEKI